MTGPTTAPRDPASERPTGRPRLGRDFGWLWTAYAVSAYGTGLGFGAFPIIAIRVLHAGPAGVAAISASGLAIAAVVALPLGPWVEFRRKRPVMVAMDLLRCAALVSIPVAYALGALTIVQLIIVSVIVGAAKIAFRAASGAYLKTLVAPEHLLVANGRFESTTWSATVIGPPLGGAAIGILGPVVTVVADAVSYLLSALGIRAISGAEPPPASRDRTRVRRAELVDGWRYILSHPPLRGVFLNTLLVAGLLLATEPMLAVLMLGRLGFAPWQYALAFAVPCAGGLIGARLSRRLVARYGAGKVLWGAGALRACWPIGLVFIVSGIPGIALVIVVQFALVTCIGVFNPVMATYRLQQTAPDRVARMLSAWTISSSATVAVLTALWGVLGTVAGPRAAIGIAGGLMLLTPLLLPRPALGASGIALPGAERAAASSPAAAKAG